MNSMSSPDTAVALGEIRASLARNRSNQGQLAQHIGLSRTAIFRRLNGDVAFTVDELVSTADFLKVSVDSLLTPTAPSADFPSVGGASLHGDAA